MKKKIIPFEKHFQWRQKAQERAQDFHAYMKETMGSFLTMLPGSQKLEEDVTQIFYETEFHKDKSSGKDDSASD